MSRIVSVSKAATSGAASFGMAGGPPPSPFWPDSRLRYIEGYTVRILRTLFLVANRRRSAKSHASGTWQVWPLNTFMRRVKNRVTALLKLYCEFRVGHFTKLSARPVVPSSIPLVCESTMAEINR
jgi:hypothetical protein